MKLAWDYVGSRLDQALGQVLDCDVMEMVAKGWAEADLLAEFADPAKHPAGEQSIVEVGAHDFSREFKPVIAVTIGSCPCVELEFGFAVSANFGGVQLAIADGHIIGGRMGEAWASATLSFQGQPLNDPAESRRMPIPGAFEFAAPGIPIPLGSR